MRQNDKKIIRSEIISLMNITPEHYIMELLCPHIAHNAKPGQFVQVRIDRISSDPLLCRPFAVYKISGDTIELMLKIAGKGTRILSEKPIGDVLDVIGPLGNGFPLDSDFQTAIIVAGGMGIASLMGVAESLKERNIVALLGACSQDRLLCESELADLGAKTYVATDDGSCGYKGFVSQLLEDILTNPNSMELRIANSRIFACGPLPMLKLVSTIAKAYNITAYVSLEERMACGLGACMGCACKVISTDASRQYKMVCSDGPVFDAQEIAWD